MVVQSFRDKVAPAVAVIVIAVLSISIAALVAGAREGEVDLGSNLSDEIVGDDPAPILPVTTGREQPVFDGAVSAAREQATVSVSGLEVVFAKSDEAGNVCLSASDDEHGIIEGCLEPGLVATGLAYMAAQRLDGDVLAFGVVPDSVDSVSVGGSDVPLERNVWVYRGRGGVDATIVVTDSDAGLAVRVGG